MPTQYTEEEYKLAKQVSCLDYLSSNGYEILKHGHQHKLKMHDSLILFDDGGFKWFSKNLSGNAITLLNELENIPINEAIKKLATFSNVNVSKNTNIVKNENTKDKTETKQVERQKVKEFILPEKNTSDKKVREYLIENRKVSKEVVDYAIANNLVYQDKKGNCIFVGYDEKQEPKFATLRGTYDKKFRKDILGSEKSCGFSLLNKNSDTLYVFESAIDSLSMMSIQNSTKDNYLSLNGTSIGALDNFLEHNKNIKTIVTCLDNDEAGRGATKKIWSEHKGNYSLKIYNFLAKDINEQLILNNEKPLIEILECNLQNVNFDGKFTFAEFENLIANNSNLTIKAKITQGKFTLAENISINYDFKSSINNHLTKSLDFIKDLKNTLNEVKSVDKKDIAKEKLELNKYKNQIIQLSNSYKKYENEKSKTKGKNPIRQKVGDIQRNIQKAQNTKEKTVSKVMER